MDGFLRILWVGLHGFDKRIANTPGSHSGSFTSETAAAWIAAVFLYPANPKFWSRH
jgi:hypothetical protein